MWLPTLVPSHASDLAAGGGRCLWDAHRQMGRGEAGWGSSAGLSTVLLMGEDPNACPHLVALTVGGLKQSLKEVTSRLNFPHLHASV